METQGNESPHHGREKWSSRTAFLLTAIAAAVGFGNVWRFPALAYRFGGGAFFLPYLLALFFVGIPILVQEIAMGQHYQAGDVGVANAVSIRFRGIGLASVVCGVIVCIYYVPLLSWSVRVFFESFGKMSDDWQDISGSEASDYFFHQVIGMQTLEDDNRPTRIIPLNVMYLAFTWCLVGGCIAFGIKWTGRIAYFTMGMPILMLFIMLIRTMTLPGAATGINEYVGQWDWSVLVDQPDIWSAAVTQIFFSIGVTFGIMTAFGAHCPKNSPAFQNSVIVAVSNSLFSFISGFCVFGILGYLSNLEGEEFEVKAGPALLFGVYPAALSTIQYGLIWIRFLFFTLILLGIDSAFSFLEAMVAVVEDSTLGSKYSKPQLVGALSSVGFLFGLLYATDAGLAFLDVIDFYINFIILFLGFCKTFATGWMFRLEEQKEHFGSDLVYGYMATTFGSVLLACVVWFATSKSAVILGFVCLFLSYDIGIIYCYYNYAIPIMERENYTLATLIYKLSMGNILQLKQELETSVDSIPFLWAVLMKHVIPPILMVLFFNLAYAKTDEGSFQLGHYEGYPTWPFQMLGIFFVLIIALIVGVGFIYPSIYDGLLLLSSNNQDPAMELCPPPPPSSSVTTTTTTTEGGTGISDVNTNNDLGMTTPYKKMENTPNPFYATGAGVGGSGGSV